MENPKPLQSSSPGVGVIGTGRPLLLASGSPRRREILTTLGIPHVVAAVDVDERPTPGEDPRSYVVRIARAKLAVAMGNSSHPPAWFPKPLQLQFAGILTADTTVILDGRPLGKPKTDAAAVEMLRGLSGRAHEVATCFALADASSRELHVETVTTRVVFRDLAADEIDAYVATSEGRDKAGAYAIQGIGGFAVARVEGSYTNVVGLPACELVAALRATGLLEHFPLPKL